MHGGGPVMYRRKWGGNPFGEREEKSHKPTTLGWLRQGLNRSDRIGRNPQTGWGRPKPIPKPKTDRELWLERIGIDVKR